MKAKKNNQTEKIINFILNILIIFSGVILLISIYTGVQTKILGNNYPNFFGMSLFEVQTGSMSDTINPGDWIVVKLTQNVNLNDIITYQKEDDYITHRVIEINKAGYVTKGDANSSKDEPITKDKIVGKVISVWSSFGILRKTLFNPAVLITLMITLFFFNMTFNKDNKGTKVKDNVISKKENKLLEKITKLIDKVKQKNQPKLREDLPLNLSPFENIKYETEEDLEKTQFFRTVSVEENEKEGASAKAIKGDEINQEVEDKLEQTQMFRTITVDSNEQQKTLNEIKQIKKENPEPKIVEKIEEPEEVIEEDESLTQINLDLLKKKKGKNIVDKAIMIKREEINEIINIFTKDKKDLIIKSTLEKEYTDKYITTMYYNIEKEKHTPKTILEKTNEELDKLTKAFLKKYKGKANYKASIDFYQKIFSIITSIKGTSKKENYPKIIEMYFEEEKKTIIKKYAQKIYKIERDYGGTLKYFLKTLETDLFNLEINTIVKNIYAVNLKHGIDFNEVYSDTIIDKTYQEGVIAENKIDVLLTLLLVEISQDMLESNFEKRYLINMPSSIYKKDKKLKGSLKMIDDEYAKESIIMVMSNKDLQTNLNTITKYKKQGYKFGVYLKEEPKQGKANIQLVDYVILKNKDIKVSKEIEEKVIYSNIENKMEGFDGE